MAEVNTTPTSASPWMMGANFGPNLGTPGIVSSPDAPDIGQPAIAGLAGLPIQSAQPAPSVVTGPATEGPAATSTSVARHIVDALGGGSGHPMDWARSILAGGLAGAANVGKVPEGGGWLAGAARGAQGVAEVRRQQMLDQQKQQQQQFENRQKEIQALREDQRLKYETAYYTQLTAASIQKAQQEGGEFAQKQQELASNYWNAIAESIGPEKAKELRENAIVSRNQLDSSHAQQIGNGTHTPIGNGEAHVPGENDKAGAVFMPNEYDSIKLKEPATLIKGYHLDEKGKIVPDYVDISAGTSLGSVKMIHFTALKQLNDLTDQRDKEAKADLERAEASQYAPLDSNTVRDFTSTTLPSYSHLEPAQRNGLAKEAQDAKTRKDFEAVQNKALQLETNGLNKSIAEQNLKANKDATVKSELGKKGLEEINKTWTDPQHGFTQVQAQAEMTKDSIQAGANGNGLATSLTPTMVVLGVNNFGQTHRISPAEAAAAGAPGGLAERFNAWLTKASSGKLSPQLAAEGQAIMDNLIVSAHRKAITNTRVIAGNAGLDPSTVTVTDVHGNPDTLLRQIQVSTPPPGAIGTMKATDGKLYWVSQDQTALGPAE